MYTCILRCMSDPQIYQTWLFLIDHWSLYATSGGFKLILEVASSLEIGNIGEAGGDTSIIETSRKDRSKACTV